MIQDSVKLRQLLARLLPGIVITSSPSPSGQRAVYFCRFSSSSKPANREKWGEVVLKVSEGISATQIAYLEKEIEILNSVHSVHYPRPLFNETFTEDPASGEKLTHRLFITIEERINAQPLSALMLKYRTEHNALLLLRRLITALEPLWKHSLKLVHRDLKPDNILVRESGDVVIIDLGIVREEGVKGATLTFSPYGPCTPLYASPEQARNDKKIISFKSDFFSIGSLMYELVSGTPPFGPADLHYADVLEKVVSLDVPALNTVAQCSPGFSALVSKMLEKEPYKRHRTIDALQADIAALL